MPMVPVRQLSVAFLSLCAAGSVSADWTGGIEAGARLGSEERPALRLYANNDSDPMSHYAYLDWTRSSGGSSYRLGYNPTFNISKSVYSFGRFSVEQDKSSTIESEIDALVGIGNNLFQRGNTRIKVEAGIGGQQLTFDEADDETRGFVFLSGGMSSSLLALLRFDASINTKASDGQTQLDGEVGLSVPVGPGTSLRYVYEVKRYNFEDPNRDDIKNNDSFFKVSYGF